MLAQLAESAGQTAEAFARVVQFYDSAFNRLLGVLAIGLFVVGVVIPLVIQRIQSRSFEKLKDELTKLKDEVGKVTKLADAKLEQMTRETDAKLQNMTDKAERMNNHYAAWVWHELNKVAYVTGEWDRSLIYWCRSIDGALDANWKDDDPNWDVWIKSRPPDKALGKAPVPWELAVKGNQELRAAVVRTMGQLQKKPSKKPYSELLDILDGFLTLRGMPKPPESP